SVDGSRIHCSDARDADLCLSGYRRRESTHAAVWLGNSQVHAVNQLKPDETNAPPIVFQALRRRGLDLLTFSQPNANLQEHAVLFAYLCAKLPVSVLVLPLVFDDVREGGLRHEIAAFLDDDATVVALSKYSSGQRMLVTAKASTEKSDTAGVRETVQERSEQRLTGLLEEHSKFWQARPELRGQLFQGLYLARNAVLGIKPSTKRRRIPGRYQDNLEALRLILDLAREKSIQVILYIAPIRSDVPLPYVESEYLDFKQTVQVLADDFKAHYQNYESLVPAIYWGQKGSTTIGGGLETDYMHFQAPGHKLLAEALIKTVHAAAGSAGLQQP
ncbi:MAG: hypothetical protein ACREO2_06295, partial [Arenimonas sp.]